MNTQLDRKWDVIHGIISEAQQIVLTTHVNPDGDGVGSQVAFYHYLLGQQKECRILNPSSLSHEYEFLSENVKFDIYDSLIHSSWVMNADLAIIFDVGDYSRLNQLGKDLKLMNTPTLSFDHHPHPIPNGFTYFIHDISASATGVLVYNYLKYAMPSSEYNKVFTRDVVKGLYTALMTDTGSFRFNNTNAEAHKMAGELIALGVNPYEIYQNVYESGSIKRIRLLASALATVQLDCNGKLAWFVITKKMVKSSHATYDEISGFSDYVRTIHGVEVVLMINEVGSNQCRVNYRSKGKVRIGGLARELGGGGHDFAAGATVELPLDQAVEYVVSKTVRVIKSQISNGSLK